MSLPPLVSSLGWGARSSGGPQNATLSEAAILRASGVPYSLKSAGRLVVQHGKRWGYRLRRHGPPFFRTLENESNAPIKSRAG